MTVTDLVEVRAIVRVDAYRVIADAVERGIMWGLQHATKHVEYPSMDQMTVHLERDIMSELCEVLDFGD